MKYIKNIIKGAVYGAVITGLILFFFYLAILSYSGNIAAVIGLGAYLGAIIHIINP